MLTLDTRIFKDDDTNRDLNREATYRLLFIALKNKISPYTVLGKDADSIDREKAFEALSEITHWEYEELYELWLKCKHF